MQIGPQGRARLDSGRPGAEGGDPADARRSVKEVR